MLNMEDPNRPVTGYPAAANHHPNSYSPFYQHYAGAAHPYPCDPPPPSNAYSNYRSGPSHHQGKCQNDVATCICVIVSDLAICICTIALFLLPVAIIAWAVLNAGPSKFPEFQVDSFSISNFTLGDDSLVSFTSEIRLTARNPINKTALAYGKIEAAIFYKSKLLSKTTVRPFRQATGTETSVTANFAAAGRFVGKSVADNINSERGENGSVNFNLGMISSVHFRYRTASTELDDGTERLHVLCGDLVVAIPGNGRPGELTGRPQHCRVKGLHILEKSPLK